MMELVCFNWKLPTQETNIRTSIAQLTLTYVWYIITHQCACYNINHVSLSLIVQLYIHVSSATQEHNLYKAAMLHNILFI